MTLVDLIKEQYSQDLALVSSLGTLAGFAVVLRDKVSLEAWVPLSLPTLHCLRTSSLPF